MAIILSMIHGFCTVLIVSAFFAMAASAQSGPNNERPTLLSGPKAVYPKEAKDAGIGGEVTVRELSGPQ